MNYSQSLNTYTMKNLSFTLPMILISLSTFACQGITGTDTCYEAQSYGPNPDNLFDIFIPDTTALQPLAVYLHGGAFVQGSRLQAYGAFFKPQLQQFIDSGIAFATIDFELITIPDAVGVQKPLDDIAEFLQYLRANAAALHIDTNRIAVYGNSSGGCAALWLDFSETVTDPYVTGAYEVQSTFDFVFWPEVFSLFPLSLTEVVEDFGQEDLIFALFAVGSIKGLQKAESYRASVDLIQLMDATDKPFWVSNTVITGNTLPTTASEINHHQQHVKYLYDRANVVGVLDQCYAPALSITDPLGETLPEFFIRKLKE